MSQLSNATLNTLQTTYYDDFDEDKKFYRILFKPAFAVQARELTQLQTIIQKQISRFGDNIFKDGSIVDGCAVNKYANTQYVRLVDSLLTGNVDITALATGKYIITNGTTANAVRASVLTAQTGFISTYPDTNQLYLKYYYTGKTGANTDVTAFSNGETLYIYNANQSSLGTLNGAYLEATINVYTSNSSTTSVGNGYCVGISDGIVYSKGFFQKVDRQITIVKRHDSSPNNMIVGFETIESIVNENQDSSLNDNAQGFTNYNAPGAHRLKLNPVLVPYDKGAVSNTFFGIAEFDNGEMVITRKLDQSYNRLMEVAANRTFEESGNYTLRPFTVQTAAVDGNTSAFFYEVSPGVSYVKGNRIELVGTVRKQVSRANTTAIAQNQSVTANYGNYVFVDDVAGLPDIDNLGEVAIYDTAQNAVSGAGGLSSGATGNIIGYANVKSLLYYSGTKGTSACQYYLYLFNIRMITGKSFLNDAKSFIKTSAPKFKADIVLESSKAVLKDTTFSPLVFGSGVSFTKSLTPTGGSVDTTFIYRNTSNSTLNANGTFSFSLSGGLGTGGVEQLYNTNARDYQITFTQNSYSANITGTISIANNSATVNGTSTTFETIFSPGDTIRFVNSTASFLGVINTIASNTSLTLTANATGIAAAVNTYNLARYYPDGTVLNITDSMLSVNAAANSFTITSGITFVYGTGNTMYAQYPVQRTLAIPAAKTVKKARYVKIDCSNNAGNTVGPWSLGLPDVYSIDKIHVSTAYSNTTTDVKSWFTLNNGQRDDSYDLASISIKPSKASQITASSKILVRLNHFVSNTSAGIGFNSIDSYPVSSDGITSNSTTITLAEIPIYKSKNGTYDLRDSIDFRPYKTATANSVANTDPANTQITINPAVANTNTYNVGIYGQYLPEADSTFTADYEYYLPRRDLVIMSPGAEVKVIQGNPELSPRLPLNITDGSVIAETFVPAFPSLTTAEGESNNRSEISTQIVLRSNKRYTMEEIGTLEDRIKRLEYYTVLSQLEQAAKATSIESQVTGTDRFKNGIFAEPFNSHNFGQVGDPAYSIAKDTSQSVMRPKFIEHPIDFQYASGLSSGVQKAGMIVTLPYVDEIFAEQQNASKYRVCTESIWQWNGSLELLPESDYHNDTEKAPAVNLNIDLSQPWLAFANSIFGTNYDVLDTTTKTSSEVVSTRTWTNGFTYIATNTAITTTTTVTANVTNTKVTTSEVEQQIGNFVSDVSIVPYIREQVISFRARSLRPNSKVHVFFDRDNVDQYCAPGIPTTVDRADFDFTGKSRYWVTPTASLGTALVANSSGGVAGIFRVPAGTYRTGERELLITNVDDLTAGANAQQTKATATFTASALAVTKQVTTLTTVNPTVKITNGITTKTTSQTTYQETVRRTENTGGDDPIAQSFKVPATTTSEGCYITKIGLYFKAKDPQLGIFVQVCETTTGLPDRNIVIGNAYLSTDSINVSDDASSETVFTFEHPVYIDNTKEYAFIIIPEGNSPDPLLWMAETGGIDVATGKNIFKDSYSGVAFVSANKITWSPMQKEDVKFRLYRAKFTGTSGVAAFINESDEYLSLDSIVRISSAVGIQAGDVVYTQNSTSNTSLTGATFPFGVVQSYNEADGTITLDSARSGFSTTTNPRIEIHRVLPITNTSLSNSTLIAYANVASVNDFNYHAVVPRFATIVPAGTNINYKFKGVDTTYSTDGSYFVVEGDKPNEKSDKTRLAMSRTNEYSFNSNNKSSYIQVELSTTSPYSSPVLDLRRKSALMIENIINNDITNEHTNNGNAACRYISKTITLADGQDAEDIKIFLRAHRPTGTDIHVYGKFQAASDPDVFEEKRWTKLSYLNATDDIYSSTLSTLDLKEYEFGFANTPNTTVSFNANTAANTTNDFIKITNNPFVNNNIVQYYKLGTDVDDPVMSGLANGTFYYVVAANSSALSLSSAQDGANIDITASSNTTTLHYLKSYIPTIKNTAYTNPDNSGIVEYYNNAGSRYTGYKYFAIKIVLTSSSGGYRIPKLNDMRAIALQI
ncbi:Domain of unknown function DUF4815 [uncultured Caudovirales phage]|uniref:DUF4815 domain-containing protein n=1 Tax=uncultured Caudovirales phage TaxID=2100421 RepID=A0A6J7WTZ2_9CAUD|nr:Domain of unknown function DUF4815 [uncultured Caudovirales phage]